MKSLIEPENSILLNSKFYVSTFVTFVLLNQPFYQQYSSLMPNVEDCLFNRTVKVEYEV